MKAAAVATKMFDAMIKDGIAYACLMTGVGQVFHIAEDDPETLYYFLVEPNLDVESLKSDARQCLEFTACYCSGEVAHILSHKHELTVTGPELAQRDHEQTSYVDG